MSAPRPALEAAAPEPTPTPTAPAKNGGKPPRGIAAASRSGSVRSGPPPARLLEETGGTAGPGTYAPEPPYRRPSMRAAVGLLVIMVVLTGVAYPAAVTGFAQLVTPHTANGSLIDAPNGTAIASSLIGQNITNQSLFWLRPSLTDYSATVSSGESPYGPTDPLLVNLTEYYIGEYGLNGTTAPFDLVSPSESGIDPDLTPAAVLVQIPRVAAASHLSEAYLLDFVNSHLQLPVLGFIGPTYVNVITLDIDLIAVEGH
ncbi:MAG: potassium-transporting ATPase subunit C [Thermoplasmata archaeon]|nr:potassium-transporting ATPase subunit C [Thermoplasmata archaeon]